MSKQNKNIKKILSIFLMVLILIPFNQSRSESIQELNKRISEQKRVIEELNKQRQVYQNRIKQKQQEALGLQNELSTLDNKIADRTLGIQTTELQIQNTELEIKSINLEMNKKEKEIELNKKRIKSSLQNLYQEEEKNNYLKILLMYDNLSDFFDEINKLKSLQSDLNLKLNTLSELKKWLEKKNDSLAKSKTELESLKRKLEMENDKLKEEQGVKFLYLAETENDESKFYNLISELQQEQAEANTLITQYEQQARRKLSETGQIPDDDGELIWPMPSKYITAYFHDPDYPFRRIFEHPGIDIRAAQGTPIKAAGSGYVAIAKDNGYGYSYIMLIHSNGLSTVYGHVSRIDVKNGDFVLQGDKIGLSGGMPGTKGAGRLTTGPHLHFEVRVNGTPVNPLTYLGN